MTKLWEPYNIPIVGLAGEPNSGKTMWGLTVDPNCLRFDITPTTLVWDTEGSSVSYVGALNFERVDITAGAANASEMFAAWKASFMPLSPRQYRVCMLDTVSEIESGLANYVKSHPSEFGYTANQFAKSAGLFWGAVKNEYKRLLILAASKCETLVLNMHMQQEFRGAIPTGKRIPKGKDTVIEVTSLYMTLMRDTKAKEQKVSQRPSGICKWPGGKSRLVRINPETGQPQQLLPPFIQDASPDGIREYLKAPPDFDNLKPSEQAIPDKILTEDERLAIKAGIASDESTRAQADLSRVELEKEIHSEIKPEGLDNKTVEDLRQKVLTKISLEDAKTILSTRYAVTKLSQLTSLQAADLEKHIDSLGN